MNCNVHVHRECTDFCLDCRVPLCTLCTYRIDEDPHCVHCYVPRRESRRRTQRISLGVLMAVLLAAGTGFYVSQADLNRKSRLYGTYAEEILRLEDILSQDQCNVDANSQLVSLLMGSSNFATAERSAQRLVDRCPTTLQTLSSLFFVQNRSLNHRGASETAEEIIRFAPHRPEGYAFRALAHQAAGHLVAAANDYTTALQLNPELLDVPMNLANVLERLDRHCDAAHPLEHALSIYPGLENRFEIERRIDRLRSQGNCALERLAAGSVELDFDRTEEVILIEGLVNREIPARFILDTGASSVVISGALASRAGIHNDGKTTPVFVQTAGGVVNAFPSRLDEIAIGGASVSDMPVLVCDTMGNEVDGLLGMSFLRRFHITLDHETGKITFRNKTGDVVDPIRALNSQQ